jgi:hypothetical protein
MSKIGDTIKTFAPLIKGDAQTWLEANKSQVISALKTAEADAVTEVGALITREFDHGTPFGAQAAKAVANAITANEQKILDALGGEDEVLYQLVLHEVEIGIDDGLTALETL